MLSSISEEIDNVANVVGSPRVIDPSLETGTYHVKVEDTEEIVHINQVGAGITDEDDISLDVNSSFYPQAFGEYTINVRSFTENTSGATTEYSANIEVIGPNGLPLERRTVDVKDDGAVFSIGGLNINTTDIKEAGTIKVSIEQEAKFSVYKGDGVSDDTKIAGEKTMTTRNGVITHGGVEFTFDNKVSQKSGATTVDGAKVVAFAPSEDAYEDLEIAFASGGTGNPTAAYVSADKKITITLDDNATIDSINAAVAGLTTTDNIDFTKIKLMSSGADGNKTAAQWAAATSTVPITLTSEASTQFSITNNALAFQIGPNTNQNVMIDVPRLDIVTLGIEEIDVTTQKGANEAIFALDEAINVLSDVRAKLGATQNRMEHTINNLQVTHENLTASESRIRDADMALEMTEFTKNNILNQAATAMLAQANQLPQGVLQLLQ